jgi:hypothetical protein
VIEVWGVIDSKCRLNTCVEWLSLRAVCSCLGGERILKGSAARQQGRSPPFEPVGSGPLFQGRNYKETVMILPLSIISRLACLSSNGLPRTGLARQVLLASAAVSACLVASASPAHGQVVMYETLRPVTSYYSPVAAGYAPMAAGYPGGYMANYSPAGNYAAVTAFSPPIATGYVANYPVASYPVTQVANYPVTQVANYAVETVASPVSVTSYYAPAPVSAAPVYAAPVTTYYAPTAVAVPLYRRGLFGGLRPARTAMYIPY